MSYAPRGERKARGALIDIPDSAFGEYCAFLAERDAAIYARHQAGESYSSIARDLGISPALANECGTRWPITEKWLNRTKVVHRYILRGMTYPEIASILNSDVSSVEYLDKSWRRHWRGIIVRKAATTPLEYGYA